MFKVEKPYKWKPGLLFLHTGLRDANCCLSTKSLFKHKYKEEWFTRDWNIDVVKEVDDTTMIVPGVFRSKVLGNINHLQISRGAKCLILLNEVPEYIMSLSSMGDNCANKLYELTLQKEVHVYFDGYVMDFVKDQLILDVETGVVFSPDEKNEWYFTYANDDPDYLFPDEG